MSANSESTKAQYGLQRNQACVLPAPNVIRNGIGAESARAKAPKIPAYLRECYEWAYLNPRNAWLLDRELIVAAILWGNHNRLQQSAFADIQPGQRVLQPACVYGGFSPALAQHIGLTGRLQVSDVAPLQVERCQRKLRDFPQAQVRLADAEQPCGEIFDAVCCYFLLHEMPSDDKRRTVDALLGCIPPGGTAIFVDYHKPHFAHPLKAVMGLIFDALEPFAKDLWSNEIANYANMSDKFIWRKQTYFGGLYQKVTAHRPKAG